MTRDKEQAGRINARTPAISGCLSTSSQEEPVMHSGRHHLLHPSGETEIEHYPANVLISFPLPFVKTINKPEQKVRLNV